MRVGLLMRIMLTLPSLVNSMPSVSEVVADPVESAGDEPGDTP